MRVCQFRHFGKSVRGNLQLPFRKGLQLIFYRGRAGCQTIQSPVRRPAGLLETNSAMDNSHKLPPEVNRRLRTLAHDLSNSLETLLQASYLLGQVKLEPNAKKWVQMIDAASQEATRINREIREILRAHG